MNKQIYLVITLQIVVSERTFYLTTTHIIEVCKDWNDDEISKEIDRYSLEVAKGYTDNLDEEELTEDSETFFFNCSELSTEVFTVNRLTKENYEILTKYI